MAVCAAVTAAQIGSRQASRVTPNCINSWYPESTPGTGQTVESAAGMSNNGAMTSSQEIPATGVAGAESRQSDRFPMHCSVRVSCLVTERAVTAQGLNISAHGMAFVAPEAVALGAVIQVTLPNSGLTALARVRNCEPHAAGWRTGVELVGSLA
jgi:hypothetical protein